MHKILPGIQGLDFRFISSALLASPLLEAYPQKLRKFAKSVLACVIFGEVRCRIVLDFLSKQAIVVGLFALV